MLHRRIVLESALIGVLAAGVVAADDVHLANGQVYEGVIAERVEDGVRIGLAFGELILPETQVERIEWSRSALAEYRERRAELAARYDSTPADWVALAGWAAAHELDHGAKEAALIAAELDPLAPGLEPLLRRSGLVFDPELSRWVPQEEYMARRGYVRSGRDWITREEHEIRVAELERERRLREEERAARQLDRAAERLERAQRAQREEPPIEVLLLQPAVTWVATPRVVRVDIPHRPRVKPDPRRGPIRPEPESNSVTYEQLARRQPGSFIPASPSDPPARSGRGSH